MVNSLQLRELGVQNITTAVFGKNAIQLFTAVFYISTFNSKQKHTSILKTYKFQNEVGIDKSTETRNDGITA